jgi:hypothetical protein
VRCKTWFRGEEKLEAHLRAVHKIVPKDMKSVRRRPDPNRKKKGPVRKRLCASVDLDL